MWPTTGDCLKEVIMYLICPHNGICEKGIQIRTYLMALVSVHTHTGNDYLMVQGQRWETRESKASH